MHNQRVDVRNVDAGLDNAGADQHVVFPVEEVENRLLQLLLGHLPVTDAYAGIRDERRDLRRHLVNSLYAIVQVVDLPAPGHFAFDRFAHQRLAVFDHVGLHREAVFRRRFDDRQIPYAKHRHMQRSRDRRRRQGKHVHIRFQLLQLLFMRYAKPLLFIDDQQAQIFEHQILGQYPMGPDHDVHRALPDPLDRLVLLLAAAEPAQRLNIDRVTGKPFAERFVMLLRQNRGRHQHRDLLAFDRRFESGPDRHLRFSVANVAAEQAVHRPVFSMSFLISSMARSWSGVSS